MDEKFGFRKKENGHFEKIRIEDPIENTEYIGHGCYFRKMKYDCPEYASEKFFPKSIDFIEPPVPADFKEKLWECYPEGKQQAQNRGISIVEKINNDILEMSQKGEKSICYILVSHSVWVDETSNIFKFLQESESDEKGVAGNYFSPLAYINRY